MEKRGTPFGVRRQIVTSIFNEDEGLASARSEQEFMERSEIFQNNFAEYFSEQYLTNMLQRIQNNVSHPQVMAQTVGFDWTNNDAGV